MFHICTFMNTIEHLGVPFACKSYSTLGRVIITIQNKYVDIHNKVEIRRTGFVRGCKRFIRKNYPATLFITCTIKGKHIFSKVSKFKEL